MEKNIFVRAFELAPRLSSIEDVRRSLKSEGYVNVDAHFAGRSIRGQIVRMLRAQAR